MAALALAGPAAAGGPKLLVGAAEDIVRQPTITQAKAQLDLMSLAGLKAVRITTTWSPGLRAPLPGEQNAIDIVADAASLTGMRVIVQVFHKDFATTPLTDGGRDEFAAYTAAIARDNPTIRDFVIGNEPNLNRFWMPQFALDGTSLSPAAYLALLARTYDELKKVSPKAQVIGGAVSPRGGDRAGGIRPTHSPTRFITELGNAYRQTGRTLPVMDSFAIHPYQDNSSTPPGFAHPNNTTIAIADYDKLVTLLGQAFDGTAQPGSTLPIFYGEFGVEIGDSEHEVGHLHRQGDRVGEAGRQRDAGEVLPRGARHGVLSAERHDVPFLPHRRRVEPRSLAVGDVLRGRHSQAEPDGGRGCCTRLARWSDREVRRAVALAGGQGLVSARQVAEDGAAEGQAQVRHRLQVPSSARASSARLDDALRAGHGARGRREERRPAGPPRGARRLPVHGDADGIR